MTRRSQKRWSGEPLLTAVDVADLIGISGRKVLALPIKQIRIGPRTIRFRLKDVCRFLESTMPYGERIT